MSEDFFFTKIKKNRLLREATKDDLFETGEKGLYGSKATIHPPRLTCKTVIATARYEARSNLLKVFTIFGK
jgi:hypothetical protein